MMKQRRGLMAKIPTLQARAYFISLILVISHFGFEGETLVLIAPVPVIAYLLTFFENKFLKNG